MPAIVWRLNYRNVELYPDTQGQSVGVRRRDNSVVYVRWLGFVSVDDAKSMSGSRPVKLEASRVSHESGLATNWIDLEPGEFVQGCLTDQGVYAVTTERIRVLTESAKKSPIR
ncbi:MAG: hypothetical protein AAF662_02695 [Pseudomonadota bacterium]